MITAKSLEERLHQLESCLVRSEDSYGDLKERMKVVKKEIANTTGAILEVERILENMGD